MIIIITMNTYLVVNAQSTVEGEGEGEKGEGVLSRRRSGREGRGAKQPVKQKIENGDDC